MKIYNGSDVLSWLPRGRTDIPSQRTRLAKRVQEFQQRIDTLLRFIHVNLVSPPLDHGNTRARNRIAHPYLFGQRTKRASGRSEEQGGHLHLREQRADIEAWHQAAHTLQHVRWSLGPLLDNPV